MRQESILAALLIGTLAVSVIGVAAADKSGAATPTVTVYPAREGAPVSSNYVLTVDGRTVPFYGVPTRNVCFASCDIAGSVTVTATVVTPADTTPPAHGILGGAQIYKVALTANEVQSLAEGCSFGMMFGYSGAATARTGNSTWQVIRPRIKGASRAWHGYCCDNRQCGGRHRGTSFRRSTLAEAGGR